MRKISLIIQREYLTRVRQKSFIVMTIIGPLLMAALFVVPVWLALQQSEDVTVLVVDDSFLFTERLENTETITFLYADNGLEGAKAQMATETGPDAVLYIHKNILSSTKGIQFIYESQPSIHVIRHIETTLSNDIEKFKLAKYGIEQSAIDAARTDVRLVTKKMDELGKESSANTEVSMMVGLFSGILIYMFIFLYGVQVMRGVIEEKTTRIIEVIISSVKPFELMMGKIIGIALVGLTQFMLWMVLTFVLVSGARAVIESQFTKEDMGGKSIEEVMAGNSTVAPGQGGEEAAQFNEAAMDDLMKNFDTINFGVIIGSFLFYFLGGYLLYSALFAAVGSAVDNEADSQQFMLPITIPIIFSFVMAQYVISNPEGPLSFWLSIIPFTSPIIMMVRIPFGVPYWELALSMVMLVIGFVATTWLAGRIYRTGILMYGKKINYRELWKWLRYH
ncbi:MAG: ABC transporter permease [Flavobacteriales bacterium]|nr:ABC transporter permease [Flavobacteriales bacterium]